MDELYQRADAAIREGVNILILSDRGIDREHAAIPALLAVSGLHHHLIRQGTRTRVSLVRRVRRATRGASLRDVSRLRRLGRQPVSAL